MLSTFLVQVFVVLLVTVWIALLCYDLIHSRRGGVSKKFSDFFRFWGILCTGFGLYYLASFRVFTILMPLIIFLVSYNPKIKQDEKKTLDEHPEMTYGTIATCS
ncbi:MAG: hypothetical protein ACPGC9_00445 [Cytophagales bacterium]